MRGALVHVFTGLVLGVALAGLLHAPTELIAQQEARTPVVQPKGATAGLWDEEQTVRLSPRVERELERQRSRRLRPKVAPPAPLVTTPARPILIRAPIPVTPAAQPAAPKPDRVAAKPKPRPKPAAPPTSTPPPDPAPAPEVVTPSPQPDYTPAADEGKKSKKSKKHKKHKKDRGEKQDKRKKKDKSDKRDEDDRGDGEDDDHDDGHDERDKHDDDDDDDRDD